jgi:hypothetical protein
MEGALQDPQPLDQHRGGGAEAARRCRPLGRSIQWSGELATFAVDGSVIAAAVLTVA